MALAFLVGCSDDKEIEQPESGMSIEQKEFDVDPSGEIVHVVIKNAEAKPECVISENARDWIQLYSWGGIGTGNSGQYTFIFKVLANDGYEATRSGSIRVTSGSAHDVVEIRQSGGSPFAFIEERQLSINADGGVLTINPKKDFKPENIKDVSDSWVTFEKTAVNSEDGKTIQMQFTIAANDTGSDRSVDIVYEDKETGLQDTFTILQGCRIVNEAREVVVSEEKQNVTLALAASLDLVVSADASWLSIDADAVEKLSIQALPDGINKRETVFTYTNMSNKISEEVKVTQVRSLRLLGNEKDVKSLTLIPDYPYQLKAETSSLTAAEELVWSSSKEAIATVSADGLITPKSVGSTVITLKAGKYKKTCSVSVKERKTLLPMKYEGKYVFSLGNHEYDGQFELTNNSSYIVTVNNVGGTSYNRKAEQGETFVCPFKITYKKNSEEGYAINWKMQIGSTSVNLETVVFAGSLNY